MVSRLSAAVLRAVLVMLAIATPSVLLGDASADSREAVALLAFCAGVLTFVEYNTAFPSLVEFRDAAPFNRLRFGMLFLTLFCLAAIERGRTSPSTLTELIHAIGALIGMSMDFPFSPVRLATLMMAADGTPEQIGAVRTAAGMAYLISLISLAIFVIIVKLGGWPRKGAPFNVWVNLPTFDPTSGGDVVARLTRDARVNIGFGFLLPFLTPAVVFIASAGFQPLETTRPQTLIWIVTLWAFLPASLFMRGIAMGRVADMIRERRETSQPSASLLSQPV